MGFLALLILVPTLVLLWVFISVDDPVAKLALLQFPQPG